MLTSLRFATWGELLEFCLTYSTIKNNSACNEERHLRE